MNAVVAGFAQTYLGGNQEALEQSHKVPWSHKGGGHSALTDLAAGGNGCERR